MVQLVVLVPHQRLVEQTDALDLRPVEHPQVHGVDRPRGPTQVYPPVANPEPRRHGQRNASREKAFAPSGLDSANIGGSGLAQSLDRRPYVAGRENSVAVTPDDHITSGRSDGSVEAGGCEVSRVGNDDEPSIVDRIDDRTGAVVALAVGNDHLEATRVLLIERAPECAFDRCRLVAGGDDDRYERPGRCAGGRLHALRILPGSRRWAEIIFSGEFAFSPELLLAIWAAGIAAAAAAVAWWQIVGPGYTWLTGSTIAVIGFGGALLDPHLGTIAGTAAAIVAVFAARQRVPATALLALSAAGHLAAASAAGSIPLAVTGALALGGITGEMLLGHWYLVSPQMPRWALRKLDVAGGVGLVLDAVLLGLAGFLTGVGGLGGWIFGLLGGVSLLLMVAVWFSLKEQGYEGVMAATGLSYLAVLTALGATAVGRVLLGGDSSFIPLG